MRTSIATVCLSGTLEEKLQACADAGFDGVEIFEPDLMVSPQSPERIRELADRLGLSLELYQPFRDFEGVGEQLLESNLRRAEAKFRLMQRLGIDTILLCSNVGTAVTGDGAVAVAQLRRLAELAEHYGVRVAYEALAWGRYVSDFEHAHRIVMAVDHPQFGHCLDSFHILSRGWDTAAMQDISADKIFFVQLADAPQMSLDVLSLSRHYRVFPGEGSFELAKFMGHLVRSGYDGPVSLEIFNDTFRQTDPVRTARDGRRALAWLEDQAASWLRENPGPAPRMSLASLPEAGAPTGFNFVEVRAEDPGRLLSVLHQLGFTAQGRHRSKAVELWSYGEARIIISEQEYQNGEPAVAAIGFDVPDPLATSLRALQLRAQPVVRTQETGEEVLQAVSAPDGSEIFFSRMGDNRTPPWMIEFGGGVARAAGDGLITAIDHVNLAQPWQHFDEAVLFFESALALIPQPSLDVAAPLGLVRSQEMRTDDGGVRLALNLAPLGSGEDANAPIYPQHIAFASTDIRSLARSAIRAGLSFLPIPDNYYDDLVARFDLLPAFVAELQELHLLYDREDDGDFLHFYTEAVGQLFFEVVERRDRYEGYGAPNAPVRLAAQHRRRRRQE